MKYRITLTEKQMRITQVALEEYFRLRMGQTIDFCDDMAQLETDLSPDNPEHERLFDRFIDRRDALTQVMKAFYGITFPSGYLTRKTDDMMIAECICDAIRTARGCNRWGEAMPIGSEPVPPIEGDVS